MLSLVEKLETMSSSKKINFNVKQIEDDFLKTKELMDLKFQKTGTKQKVIDRNFFRKSVSLTDNQIEFEAYEDEYLNDAIKDTKEKELFNSKYIPDITKDELQKKLKDYENNKGMKEYLNIQIKNYNKNPTFFSNEKFLTNVYESITVPGGNHIHW